MGRRAKRRAMMLRGASIKESAADKWLGRIGPILQPGEVVTLIARVGGSVRMPIDGLVVTSTRVFAAWMRDLPGRAPMVGLELGDVTGIGVARKTSGAFLVLTDRSGGEHTFGRFHRADDIDLIRGHLKAMAPSAQLIPEQVIETIIESRLLGRVTTQRLGEKPDDPPTQEPPSHTPTPPPRPHAPPPEGFVRYGSTPQPDPWPRFDASKPPRPGDPVPEDCVWATRKHPGPMPARATFGNQAKRLRVMGDPTARTEAEIVAALGRPQSRSVVSGDGGYLLQWQHTSNWSYNSHVALEFDRYGVCAGITHHWQDL